MGIGFGDIAQIFLILLILVGVMYSLLYLVKKYLFTYDKKSSGSFKMNVIATQMLMPKKFVSVVRIKDKLYILGVSDNSISLLDKKDFDPDEIEFMNGQQTEGTNFLDVLKKSMGKK